MLVLAMQFSKARPRRNASRGGGMAVSGAELDGNRHPFCRKDRRRVPLPQNRAVKTDRHDVSVVPATARLMISPPKGLSQLAGTPGSRGCREDRRPVLDVGTFRLVPKGVTSEMEAPFGPDSEFLRKEVIQPHLPVRLPCYDFTPIANPTFDGSLPKGLGHRLRVLPTFVV